MSLIGWVQAQNQPWNPTFPTLLDHPLRWRHNDHAGVSNHQPHGCLLNRLFRRKSKKTSKLRVTGLCVGNSPGTGEFPAQMVSYAENVSIWWRHHDFQYTSAMNINWMPWIDWWLLFITVLYNVISLTQRNVYIQRTIPRDWWYDHKKRKQNIFYWI